MTQLPEELLIEQEKLDMGSIPSQFKAEQQVCTSVQAAATRCLEKAYQLCCARRALHR